MHLAVLLAATKRMVFGTGIANIWARQPQTMHAAAAFLAQAYPGRFVLGLGVGYPHAFDHIGAFGLGDLRLEHGIERILLVAHLFRTADWH